MLVIFDCDGVLVDSEVLAAEVFSRQLAIEGICFSTQSCFNTFKGRTLKDCLKWINNYFNVRLTNKFIAALKIATTEAFNVGLKSTANVVEVLNYLDKCNVEYCVASNGCHEKIRHSLTVTGLVDFFPDEKRFSAQDVAQGKPSPELFLHAAESLGVPRSFCWVVEDSLYGIQAAQSAGMSVIAYAIPDTDLKQGPADVGSPGLESVNNMNSLLKRFEAMGVMLD